jgi:hypothetical protein
LPPKVRFLRQGGTHAAVPQYPLFDPRRTPL